MNKGIWYGIAAYAIWGLFPLYWKAITDVPPFQIVAHRLVWSLVFLVLVILLRKDWAGLLPALKGRTLLVYTAAACILTVNWLVYVWAVNSGFVVETSLGYFINPLVSVLMGVVFLREKLSTGKLIPVLIATAGVLYLTISYGSLPWISLALAFTFALYGLLKKLSPLGSLHGLTIETAILFIPSVIYLLFMESQGSGSLGHAGPLTTFLIVFAGVVTALPLLLFSSAARSIPLTTVGLLQYIAPTLQFLLGVVVYREHFSQDKLIGFGLIWLALLLFSVGGLYDRRRALSSSAA
jgi:chloramphenicol-sensitive protein RarD